jgi:hypothetical protein
MELKEIVINQFKILKNRTVNQIFTINDFYTYNNFEKRYNQKHFSEYKKALDTGTVEQYENKKFEVFKRMYEK